MNLTNIFCFIEANQKTEKDNKYFTLDQNLEEWSVETSKLIQTKKIQLNNPSHTL